MIENTGIKARIQREEITIRVMINLYCRDIHGNQALCDDCLELRDYALERLKKCPFQEGKTTCAKCPVHCYKTDMRQKIRAIMRYAGPRMLVRHPLLAIYHLMDGWQDKPKKR